MLSPPIARILTGSLFGCLSCIKSADLPGRKRAILVASLFAIVGGALQAGSVDVGMYLFSRFVTGLGAGSLVVLVPLYQSEIAPPRIRGLLVGMHGVMICVGYALASWIGLGFYFVNASGAQWRLPLAIQCLAPLLLAMGVSFLPESPRWLLDQDRYVDALSSFEAVRAESDDSIIHNREAIWPNLNFSGHMSSRKRLWDTVFGIFSNLRLCADAALLDYGSSLYEALDFSVVSQLLIQCGWVTVCPVGNLINSLLVDRVGRTRLLSIGFSGIIVALIGECIAVSRFQSTGSRAMASLAVFFLFMHIACFSTTSDATSYIYASEIFPTALRAKGLAVSTRQQSLEDIGGLFGDKADLDENEKATEVRTEYMVPRIPR
ncbi:major facilitator superfamily transporter sugar [Grosmannia clavigera kw1407]|uniref:Major facilitator superfamily transporter sugar n=1 Tax=Grosmannia clavigera (strain kw1407 / UAMH 11150) TaxID=655863 RepID=F0XES6_GROCL|nr:major facilitator superfamily transporter sugar [Grosmannia clavigera kw1407]EFX04561.1 major facilitator superfamily transporter sugar [Grosmannia clavigera kw1407]